MSSDYRRSHLNPEAGQRYHGRFSTDIHRRMVWRIEQKCLKGIQNRFCPTGKIRHLDFACGTGRILELFDDCDTISSVGVDLSPSMLAVAREVAGNAETIEADITRDDVLGDRKFDLITAFRFFPNAEPSLRSEAISVLVKHLDANGHLVFNNHLNASSLSARLLRIRHRRNGIGHTMSMEEVENLVSEAGLRIEAIYHVAVTPGFESHPLLPFWPLFIVESGLSRLGFLRNLAKDLIFVCKHAG